jgi:hypothetical protein
LTQPRKVLAQNDQYELRFAGASNEKRGYAFPCDQTGRVDIDELTDLDRTNYFYARTVIGKELSAPTVVPVSRGQRLDDPSARVRHLQSELS